MLIAIVDDIAEERILLRTRLENILNQKNVEFHCYEYENGEAFLKASKNMTSQFYFWTFIWTGQMESKSPVNLEIPTKTVC